MKLIAQLQGNPVMFILITMLQIDSLTDLRIFESPLKVAVSDLDYTLTDFGQGHLKGIDNISKILGKEIASEANNIYKLIHEEHSLPIKDNWKKQKEFDEAISLMKSTPINNCKGGFRKYSREVLIIAAAKKLNKKITNKDVEKGRDAYWTGVAENSPLYSDTNIFLKGLSFKRIPLIIMTGSDSLMKVNNDLSVEYYPDFSISYKTGRVKKTGINYRQLVIGDPIDKPKEGFFDLVDKEIKKIGNFKKENILFIGDSYQADLKVPEKRGYKTILIKR